MQYGRWIAPVISLAMAATLITSAVASAAATSPKDTAILQAGVVTATDVPQTWTASNRSDTTGKQFNGISSCNQLRAVSVAAKKATPHALSQTFADTSTSSGLPQANDTAYAFKNTAGAKAFLAAYKTSTASSCVQQLFQKLTGKATVTSITSQLQGVGDDNVGFEGTLTGTQNGQPATATADIIGVRVGRAFVGFTFVAEGSQAITQGPAIVNAVVNRVKALPQ